MRCVLFTRVTLSLFLCFPIVVFAQQYPLESPSATPKKGMKVPLGKIEASLSYVTNYIDKGISSTDNGPAVQSVFTYTLTEGYLKDFYFSLFTSNILVPGTNSYLEFDPQGGYTHKFSNNILIDTGVLRNTYPKTRKEFNYTEYYFLATFNGVLTAGLFYSDNTNNTGTVGIYYVSNINYTIPSKYTLGIHDVSLQAALDYYHLQPVVGHSYVDYLLGITKTYQDRISLQVAYINTKNANPQLRRFSGPFIVGSLTLSF